MQCQVLFLKKKNKKKKKHLLQFCCSTLRVGSISLSADVYENCWMLGKQYRPWSDDTFCSVWSGCSLFAQACLNTWGRYTLWLSRIFQEHYKFVDRSYIVIKMIKFQLDWMCWLIQVFAVHFIKKALMSYWATKAQISLQSCTFCSGRIAPDVLLMKTFSIILGWEKVLHPKLWKLLYPLTESMDVVEYTDKHRRPWSVWMQRLIWAAVVTYGTRAPLVCCKL